MNRFCILLTIATVLLLAEDSVQTGSKFRRSVSQSNRRYRCGDRKRQIEGLITKGANTKLGEWPWHGALFYKKNRRSREYKCGATLIHQNFVVTAGHCVVDRESGYEVNAGSVTIDFGYVQLFSPSSHGQSHTVQEIFVHPEFSKDSNKHDIAILSLKTAVRFSDYILPICLGSSKSATAIHDLIGQQGVVVGWGLTEDDSESSDLKMANVPVVDYPECQESDPDLFGPLIFSGMFCAGSRDGTSVCNGDSGGGMYFKNGGRWTLRGITSFSGARNDGSNKCDVNNYAGFTNVRYYASWIDQTVNVDEVADDTANPTENPTKPPVLADPLPWREPPREAMSSTNHSISTYTDVPGPLHICPRGERCLEMSECVRMQPSPTSTFFRSIQRKPSCDIQERGFNYICCEIPETDDSGKGTCGKRMTNSHPIKRPTISMTDEYPWMAKIRSSSYVFECQGVLVTTEHVLISAYCRPGSEIDSVRLGRTARYPNRCISNLGCYDFMVERVIYHPRFSENKSEISEEEADYSVGLVELSSPVQINQYVNVICLPIFNSEPKISAIIVATWPFTEQVSNIGRRIQGIAYDASLLHYSLAEHEEPSQEQLIVVSQGSPMQWENNNGQMFIIGMETNVQNSTHIYALTVKIVSWIRSVAGLH